MFSHIILDNSNPGVDMSAGYCGMFLITVSHVCRCVTKSVNETYSGRLTLFIPKGETCLVTLAK